MIHADAAFTIGKTHKICEDYAISSNNNGGGARKNGEANGGVEVSAWLCDGCSSSPHTDVGARLLAHAVRNRADLFARLGGTEAEEEQARGARDDVVRTRFAVAARSARSLGLPADGLDATLFGLVAVAADNSSAPDGGGDNAFLHCVIYGDGALVFGLMDGARIVYRFQYPAGYPFYPAYLADEGRMGQWRAVAGNALRVTKTALSAGGVVETSGDAPNTPPEWLRHSTNNLAFAAVLSDGVESFHRANEEMGGGTALVDYLEVVKELTAFKSFKGEFVQRRMQAFTKDCARRGVFHNDDVSVAAVSFE